MIDAPIDSVATPKAAIDWFRSTPWWRIASQTLGISWRASHLALCAAAMLITYAFGVATHQLLAPQDLETATHWVSPIAVRDPIVPVALVDDLVTTNDPAAVEWALNWKTPRPFLNVWRLYASPVYTALLNPTLRRTAYGLINFAFVVALWSFVGGCLARRSLVELGTRGTATWSDTAKLVFSRWQSIAWSVTMPLGLVALCSLFPLIAGWISNIPYVGPWLAGLIMIPVVLLSVGLGWCAAISLLGYPLSICAVTCERQADAFDGVSRSAAYTFQRPLTLILCVAAAELFGRFGGALVALVLNTGYLAIASAFDVGSFYSLGTMGTMWDGILTGIIPLVIAAFGFSFFWTASAATYLILRRDVDHAEFDVIDMGTTAEPKPLPELPKLEPASPAASTPTAEPTG